MITNLQKWWEARKEQWRYRYLPKLVDRLIDSSNSLKASEIEKAGATRIMIDNSVIGKSIVQETAWINTGKKMWGNVEIDTGYAARIPVYHEDDNSDVANSVKYLPAISRLAHRGKIQLFSSSELRDETWTQPSGRYIGYGPYDYGLFSSVTIETIHDKDYFMQMGPSYMGLPSAVEQRKKRISHKTDEIFLGLMEALGSNSSQDCYHIAFAERNDMYCFLTMDFKLLRNLNARRKHPAVAALKVKILSPYDFGTRFQLMPISTRLFSHHDASFPVAWEESWPVSGRQLRKKKAKEKPELDE